MAKMYVLTVQPFLTYFDIKQLCFDIYVCIFFSEKMDCDLRGQIEVLREQVRVRDIRITELETRLREYETKLSTFEAQSNVKGL